MKKGNVMKNVKYLVVGASGTVGSELVKILKAGGHSVRSTTSKPAQGPEVAHINLVTGEGMSAAFEGIERAFFLAPLGYADQYKILSPLTKEATTSGLEKVVLMTGMGANADEAAGLRRAEVELEKSGLGYNIIRPNWFLQNFNTVFLQGIKEQGKILVPAGNAKTSFIDAKDISAVAAQLLTSDRFNNEEFDITGPQALDHDEALLTILYSAADNSVLLELIHVLWQRCRAYKIVGVRRALETSDLSIWSFQARLIDAAEPSRAPAKVGRRARRR